MTVVALGAAQMLADDVDAWGMPRLRALLPVAGMTLIEHQAQRVLAAQVSRMLLLVDGVPPALADACDRIRGRGLIIDLVRDGADVVRAMADCDTLLLIADGLIAGAPAWLTMAGNRGPTLLTTDDTVVTQQLERIDAGCRWAGLATIPAPAARTALAEVRDGWDPQLSLVRRAVQDGAVRVPWDQGQFVNGDIALATNAHAAAQIEQRTMAIADVREAGIGRRWLIAPMVRLFATPLLASQRSGAIARTGAFVMASAGLATAVVGHSLPALGCALIAMLLHGAGDFVARYRPETAPWRWLGWGTVAIALACLPAIMWDPVGAIGWRTDTGLFAVTLLSEWRRRRGSGYAADLPFVIAMLMPLIPAIGIAAAAKAVTLVSLGLLLFDTDLHRRREPGPDAV